MDAHSTTEDVYEERIARFIELAEAAQLAAEVAGDATRPKLQETYATIAQHWLTLARMARDTIELNRKLARQVSELKRDQQGDRIN